jgi:RNA polymerase sigma-70 factor (ECF subfamily)
MAPGPGESFDTVVVPHLDAAHRLARWLVRDEHDAEDVVQEASVRAFRYFNTFDGGDGRAWFLRIVRNTCYGWRRNGSQTLTDSYDEEQHSHAGVNRMDLQATE